MKKQTNYLYWRVLGALAAVLSVVGCASRTPAPVVERGSQAATVSEPATAAKDLYTVKKGDTLRSIARAHGVDFRELIAWNSIENPNSIQPGVSLRVKPAGSSSFAYGASSGTEVAVTRPISATPYVENRSLDSSPGSINGSTVGTTGAPSLVGTNTPLFKREPKGGKEVYSDAALAQAQGLAQSRAAEPAPMPVKADTRPEARPEAAPVPPVLVPAPLNATPPAAPVAPANDDDVAWMWPNTGKIIGNFSEGASKGVDIAGKAGDPVLAAGEGKVVYSGTGLRGYGKLVIVKHNSTYLSAYAHNQSVLVKEGQSVTKGQKIAEMGNSDADQVKLHFEVRRQGKPVDPLKYLPPR